MDIWKKRKRTLVAALLPLFCAAPAFADDAKQPPPPQNQQPPAAQSATPAPPPAAPAPAAPAAPAAAPTAAPVQPAPANKEATASPAPASPATAVAQSPPAWHKARMRLSGSLCMACLKDFQNKVLSIDGLNNMRVKRAAANYSEALSPELGNWVEAVITYDAQKVRFDQLKQFMRQNGYFAFHITDQLLDHEPNEHDMKL